VKRKLGMVPNLHATFAVAPAVLDAYLAYSDTLATGRLSATQREIIALTVGQANQCQYCLSAHTMIGKNLGLSDRQVEDARRGRSGEPLDNAIAVFASILVAKDGIITDDELEGARRAGLDDELLLEILANVALNILTNYANHLAQTDIDFPVVDCAA
jgi:uncharacterized peroxidase-related enzyme